jgi:hypothetical protein
MNLTELTDLQIDTPPMPAECIGYQGRRRWIALYVEGEDYYYDDGRMSGTASSAGWEMFIGHPHIAPRLYPHHGQMLLLDRTNHKLYCAPHARALAWLAETGATDAIPQVDDLEQLAKSFAAALDMGSWTEVHIDDAEIERRVAAMWRRIEQMSTWLDEHVPPTPSELL